MAPQTWSSEDSIRTRADLYRSKQLRCAHIILILNTLFSANAQRSVPTGLPNLATSEFVISVSCWTLSFLLYLFITSGAAFKRIDGSVGRFFNQKVAFAADFLSALFWFAAFIALAVFYQALSPDCEFGREAACGMVITSVFVGVCVWYESSSPFTSRDID